MPIPDRLRPLPPTAEEIAAYTDLCRQIGGAGLDDSRLPDLLARWNDRAGTTYAADEFTSLDESQVDAQVRAMLMGQPSFVADLTYTEIRDVFVAVTGDVSEAELSYYLRWFDVNLPGANVADLIFRPDLWFNSDRLFQADMTYDQALAYAMARSGRRIPGAPENVPLPYPIPS